MHPDDYDDDVKIHVNDDGEVVETYKSKYQHIHTLDLEDVNLLNSDREEEEEDEEMGELVNSDGEVEEEEDEDEELMEEDDGYDEDEELMEEDEYDEEEEEEEEKEGEEQKDGNRLEAVKILNQKDFDAIKCLKRYRNGKGAGDESDSSSDSSEDEDPYSRGIMNNSVFTLMSIISPVESPYSFGSYRFVGWT